MEKIVKANYLLWDCESSLYDSVELKSFERQLNSAIFSCRSLSMPHFIDRHCTHEAAPPPAFSKKSSTSKIIPRALQKLIRSFFKSKSSNNNTNMGSFDCDGGSSSYVINYQRFGALTTIPEIPENLLCNICINGGDHDHRLMPEKRSLIGRSASQRFTTVATGISCA